ncbi:7-carboxy-7-deazaguanine synthase QueE [Cognatiluteimonas profundi]|uniref:7-carboxy-7-deazaguanine synthase QueE n=1 Tax=Cognatiluteimonas profundi TaxID=2594501 RepID=UPI00131B17FA|nr:7-carboxy-7-deazaguanine synthase QueE [Lysobacter profundi]
MPAPVAHAPGVVAPASTAERLKLTEIFLSLQGEARDSGWPTVFVRLTGCPLRCQYCDTAYAFHGGDWWEIDAILAEVARHGVRHVCVTGGEPLAQKRCIALLGKLCDAGYTVSLETSGAIDIGEVDARVSRVVDIKTPGSMESSRNRWENLALLTPHDQLKFVICDRADFEWARDLVATQQLQQRCDVIFSPSFAQIQPRELADWIVAEALPVRYQLQLHKLLWNDEPGR